MTSSWACWMALLKLWPRRHQALPQAGQHRRPPRAWAGLVPHRPGSRVGLAGAARRLIQRQSFTRNDLVTLHL